MPRTTRTDGDEGVTFVDVTLPMTKLFNPDEQTIKILEQIGDTDPVPLEELQKHEH